MNIREAKIEDIAEIADIYNYEVLNGVATFDTEIKSYEEQKMWYKNHTGKYRIFVADIDGKIAGWVSLSKWIDKRAAEKSAELSLYINKEYRGKGLGNALMKKSLSMAEKDEIRTVISLITEGNNVSINLHEKMGFILCGRIEKVAEKFGKELNLIIMQKIFE